MKLQKATVVKQVFTEANNSTTLASEAENYGSSIAGLCIETYRSYG